MDEALDSFLQFDEHTEVRDRADLAIDLGVEWLALSDAVPRIIAELLDSQAYAFVLDFYSEHHCLNFVALLVDLRRMTNFLDPRKVRQMYETVDPRLDFDEHAEVGNRFDLALDRAAHRMNLRERFPRIGFGLLEPKRNPAVALVDS